MTPEAAPDTSGQTGGSPTPGDRNSGAGPTSGGQSSSDVPSSTYTQEQVERIIKHRLGQYSDYDEIKKKLADAEQAGQSELEKANTRAQEAASSAQRATQRADALLIRQTITAEAARAGAIDPDVVVALLADQFTVEDDVVKGDIPKAVGRLLEQRTYLKANGTMRGVGSADAGRHSPPGKGSAETPASAMDDMLRSNR